MGWVEGSESLKRKERCLKEKVEWKLLVKLIIGQLNYIMFVYGWLPQMWYLKGNFKDNQLNGGENVLFNLF